MGVHPRRQSGEVAGLHVDSAGAADFGDETFTAEETRKDAASQADADVDRWLIRDEMPGIDDVLVRDFLREDAAVAREPDAAVAFHLQSKQALTPDEAG